jgi:hypothetical protein
MTRTIPYASPMLVVVALAVSAALLGGCAQKPATTPESTAPQTAAAPRTMQLLEPVDGATVPAGDVKMLVKTTGHKFVMASNTNVPGEGHVHFTLDGEPFKMSVTPDYVYAGVTPGEHTLEAELVQNDTKSFSPPVKQEIVFTAK